MRYVAMWLRAVLLAVACTVGMSGLVHADALTPLRSDALPPVPASGTVQGLATLDGRVLAIVDGKAWLLDQGKDGVGAAAVGGRRSARRAGGRVR